MNFKGIEICCPKCRGELVYRSQQELSCLDCHCVYPILLGIPDLRVFPDPYIGIEEDRAKAQHLAAHFNQFDFERFVDFYYDNTPVVPKHHANLYKRGLMAAPVRTAAWLRSWEAAGNGTRPDSLLEIGCGTAPLLVAARNYPLRVGVDIALRWLALAKKRVAEAGLDLPLICACAEALPFRDATFERLVADSVLEHLRDQLRALAEAHRVLHAGGRLFIATPNRFSLGPDPQSGIWGGGWLPRRWSDALVRRAGGIPPRRTLLDLFSLQRLLHRAGFDAIRVFLPAIPAEQQRYFSPLRRQLSAAYELGRRFPGSRHLLYLIGPLLHAVAAQNPEKTGS